MLSAPRAGSGISTSADAMPEPYNTTERKNKWLIARARCRGYRYLSGTSMVADVQKREGDGELVRAAERAVDPCKLPMAGQGMFGKL